MTRLPHVDQGWLLATGQADYRVRHRFDPLMRRLSTSAVFCCQAIDQERRQAPLAALSARHALTQLSTARRGIAVTRVPEKAEGS